MGKAYVLGSSHVVSHSTCACIAGGPRSLQTGSVDHPTAAWLQLLQRALGASLHWALALRHRCSFAGQGKHRRLCCQDDERNANNLAVPAAGVTFAKLLGECGHKHTCAANRASTMGAVGMGALRTAQDV